MKRLSRPLVRSIALLSSLLWTCACRSQPEPVAPLSPLQARVQGFLDDYVAEFQPLYLESAEAEWASNTRIVEGDDTNAERTREANEALAVFTGSVENIEAARGFLEHRGELTRLQALQLESILFMAADKPQTVPLVVRERIAAETAQTEALYGFTFTLNGEEITTNEIDARLGSETDVDARLAVWRASKDVGPTLRSGLADLQRLRNETVRALGYPDFFSYMVSEYGMTLEEMTDLVVEINRELRPLFRELHTWARHELAARYGQPVPDLIPAHWLPNRWGQDWSSLVDVEGFDLDAALSSQDPKWFIEQAEQFYVSLGFDPLPRTFYERSSLYPVSLDAGYKKNNHASAWHLDLDTDVRSLMSVEPDTKWYETTHHELGHIYYYMCYSTPEVPVVLRGGANRAYHEAIGSLMGLAAMQPRFVEAIGLDVGGAPSDPMQVLLKEALKYVVFIPWSAGTMFHFEKELYAEELPQEEWNRRWWELKARYQGIAPPAVRDERYCDPATKTHVNNDPAGYYDYALSFVLLFQLHDHIAREILGEDPRDTNYYGRSEVGDFLASIMTPGASIDWREVLREKVGEGLSARAMVAYFEPLMQWLREANRGREATMPAF